MRMPDRVDGTCYISGVVAHHVQAVAPDAIGQGWLLGRPAPVDRLPLA